MTDVRNQHEMTVFLMDDTTCAVNLEVSYMGDGPSAETPSSTDQTEADVSEAVDPGCLIQNYEDNDSASVSNETTPASSCCSGDSTDTVPRAAGNLTDDIEEFMLGVRRFYKNIFGEELLADEENEYRQLFSAWNTFLQPVQGIRGTFAFMSSDIKDDINKFIPWQEERRGAQCTEGNKKEIKLWLPRWNMFLQERAGETLVTWWNVCLTIVGFIFYIVDLASDIGTSMYYATIGQWWRAMITLAIIYGAVIIHTIIKWTNKEIHCIGAVDWLRYVASLLVNWPDVKQYGALCLLEWKLHKSSGSGAHLVPEWHLRRLNIAYLKFTEGVCEACPQAILQLSLLIPDLYGDWTWTGYLRIAGTCVSLCTAGAALVNKEKFDRIVNYTDLALSELAVLHVWAAPVTVSRLLSVALLLDVHWAMGVSLVLSCIYWCRTKGGPRALTNVIDMCLSTLLFLMSPFGVAGSITYRRVLHTIHFLVNTSATVVWAAGTPLVHAHPALYSAIICFNTVMFAMGLVGMELHEKYWPDSYL